MQGLPTIYVLMSFITVGQGHPLTWTPERTYSTMSECQRVLEETQKKDYLSPPEQKCVRYRPD